jgi:hypothetical protein
MTWPSRYPLEARNVATTRGDYSPGDALDIVLGRKSQAIDQRLNCGVERGFRNLLFPLRGGRDDGLERAMLGIALPFPQHLDCEMPSVGIDRLAMDLAHPDPIRVMPPLFRD